MIMGQSKLRKLLASPRIQICSEKKNNRGHIQCVHFGVLTFTRNIMYHWEQSMCPSRLDSKSKHLSSILIVVMCKVSGIFLILAGMGSC